MGLQTLVQFRSRTTAPTSVVDESERLRAGWIQTRLDGIWSRMYGRLRKRYALAFDATSPPLILLEWQTTIMTAELFAARGWDPNNEQDKRIQDAADQAWSEIREAADSKDGLFDLPLIEGAAASGITDQGPMGSAQVTAYDWIDVEAAAMNGDLSGFDPQ